MAASNVVADPQGTLAPIVVDLVVPCPPDRAFHYFTHDIGRWWPLATHSLGRSRRGGRAFRAARRRPADRNAARRSRAHLGNGDDLAAGPSSGIQLAPRSRSRDRAVGRCSVRGRSRRHARDAHARRLGAPRGRRHGSRELRGWLEVRARGAVWRVLRGVTAPRVTPKTLDPRLRGDDAVALRPRSRAAGLMRHFTKPINFAVPM